MWVGILVIVGMGLYPPWEDTLISLNSDQKRIVYSWIWERPETIVFESATEIERGQFDDSMLSRGVRTDMARLLIQWVCVGLVTAGLMVSLIRPRGAPGCRWSNDE